MVDGWQIDVPGITAGTDGTLSLTVGLDGMRTSPFRNAGSYLGLGFTNYGNGVVKGSASVNQAYAGTYVLTVPFVFGIKNGVTMGLTAETSFYNEFTFGEQYVDFYDSAKITDLTFFDALNNKITNFTFIADFGHDYLPSSQPVPEPATLILFGSGLAALAGFKRKKGGTKLENCHR